VHDIIGRFTVGILTSASEGLSNVLIEYALCGIPSVAFGVGGNSEIIVDGETGYVVPDGDEALMAEKIDFLLENPEVLKKFGQIARDMADAKFSVKNMVSKAEEFYIRILDEIAKDRKGSRKG
jgi:glycosyltransferase involved in cell wall biosynthesis